MLLDRFQPLQDTDLIPNYLSSGCSLTVLYSDMLTVGEPPEGTHTHYWLRKLGILDRTIPLRNANFSNTGISDYNVISGSEPIQNYFDYVEGYTHILGFEDGDRTQIVENNPESIAESPEEDIIAARVSRFRNRSGEILELEGNLTLLPQPTRLQPLPQNLIEALAAIGEVDKDNQKPVTHGLPSDSNNLPQLITSKIQKELNKSSYGDEVLQQIKDGDACVTHDLLQPALGSYIHAIEWAFIAYLESEQGIDIIQKEQQGGTYYLLRSELIKPQGAKSL